MEQPVPSLRSAYRFGSGHEGGYESPKEVPRSASQTTAKWWPTPAPWNLPSTKQRQWHCHFYQSIAKGVGQGFRAGAVVPFQ